MADGALCGMALSDITASKGDMTDIALVGAVAGVCTTTTSLVWRHVGVGIVSQQETYDAGYDASSACRAGMPWCSKGNGTCHRHP